MGWSSVMKTLQRVKPNLFFAHRGIVLASHLKPLERKDKMGGKRSVPWNCHTIHGRTFPEVTTEISQVGQSSPPTVPPTLGFSASQP